LIINSTEPEKLGMEEWQIDWEHMDEKFLGATVAVRGSMGCPLRCKFCSFVVLHDGWDLKGVDWLRSELRSIATRSSIIKSISFSDDNVFLSRKDVNQYTRMMAEEKLPFNWSGYVRVSNITEDNIDWLSDSKCIGMNIGIESGDRQMLKNMRKGQNPERILKSIDLVNSRGISTASSFIVGFPGETEESVGNTIKMLNSFAESGPALNFYTAWVFAAIPLTPADTERADWNLKGHLCDWEHSTMNVGDAHRQVQRMHREVTQGAYLHYPADDVHLSTSTEDRKAPLEALKLRHSLAVIDEYEMDTHCGRTRPETLDRLEQVVAKLPITLP
jgi:p-methyltransferase